MVANNSNLLSAWAAIKQISETVPESCRANIIVVGSLAAGFNYFGNVP